MGVRSKSVCVIGLGPSGIVAVKELRAAGLQVTAFDANSSVGGLWSLSKGDSTGGVWKELCWNGTRRAGGYSDFVWKREDYVKISENDFRGVFPHNTEVGAYLEAYVEHFELRESCVLNTWVESVEPLQGGRWNVTAVSKQSKKTEYVFDYLVVCSGRHAIGRNQLIKEDGTGILNAFDGEILHSIEMKSIHDFENKRVLVVGNSASGTDISSELARKGSCTRVVNSVRHVPYHIERISPVDNVVVDDILFQRLSVLLGRYLPETITSKGFKSAILEKFPSQLTADITGSPDLVPDDDILKAGIGYGTDYVKGVKEKKLVIKPGINSASGNTVFFRDDSKEDFDVVICATGYDADFSFLPKDVKDKVAYTSPFTGSKEAALYKYTLAPDVPNLAFIGLFSGVGPIFMAFEIQARYIAAIFSGEMNRPSDAKIRAGVDEFKRYRSRGPMNALELSIKVSEDVGDELGITPSTFQAICNPRNLLMSPIYPFYYRTNEEMEGKEVAAKAEATVDYLIKHPNKALY